MDDPDLLAFADVLLPGDGLFPAASATGIGAMFDRFAIKLAENLKGLAEQGATERITVVAQLQAAEPDLFAEAQKFLYLAYYEQPEVIAAIRAMGFTYHAAPLPDGYPLAPFDSTIDTPRHGRGHWIPTHAVRPIDGADLAHAKA